MSIKSFVKKYKYYLIIGTVVGITLSLIFILSKQKDIVDTDINVPVNSKIKAPFPDMEIVVLQNFPNDTEVFQQEYLNIYKVEAVSQEYIEKTIKFLKPSFKKMTDVQSGSVWRDGYDILNYSNSSGILSLSSPNGLSLDYKITSKTDVESLIKDLLKSRIKTNISSKEVGNGNILYTGVYLLNNEAFGSINLNGDAFKIEVNKFGAIRGIDILLFDDQSVSLNSKVSPLSKNSVTEIKSYAINYIKYDAKYLAQKSYLQASAKLISYTTQTINKEYIFKDFEYSYIFPSYLVSAVAKLKDSAKNEYTADITIVIPAIPKEYLETYVEEEPVFVDPAVN